MWLLALFVLLLALPLAAAELPKEPMLRIEAGMHMAVIYRIGLSADGTLLATGSDDKTVRLWALPEGRLLRVLRLPVDAGNGGRVYAVALSPDGKLVAAGGWDAANSINDNHYVYLFDTSTGALLRRFGPLPNVVRHLRFAAEGRRLVAGLGGKNSIRLWEPATGKELKAHKSNGDNVYGADFAPDGRLAVTSLDGQIRLYDAKLELLKKIKAPGGKEPFAIAFAPNGAALAVGYDDTTTVDVLSAATLKRLFTADTTSIGNGRLGNVAWSADGRTLFAAGRYYVNGEVPILAWGEAGKGKRRVLPGPQNSVIDLLPYGADGVAYGAADPGFGLLDGAGKPRLVKGPVTADMRAKLRQNFTLSADARQVRFGMGYGGEEPWLFDLAAPSLSAAAEAPAGLHEADITSLGVTGWEDEYEPKLGKTALKLDQYERSRSLAILPDKSGFLLGTGWSLRRFDAKGKEKWKRPVPSDAWGVNLSADGKIATAAYADGTIRWHRSKDGAELLALFVHKPDKRWVAWTPSGYYMASPGGEDLIGWHVNNGLDTAPDFFPASRFRERFYRPDIVQAVLDTLDEKEAIKRANEAAKLREAPKIETQLPPVVAILSPSEGATFSGKEIILRYSLRSPSGLAVDGVEALIDGRPARGLMPVADDALPDKTAVFTGEITVALPARDVELGLIARSGGISSDVVRVRLVYQGAAPAGEELLKPKLYALVVGVSKYQRPELELNFAAKDAEDFAKALKAQEGGLYGAVEIKLLTEAQATRQAVELGLSWLEKQVTSRDIGVVFLAGHGKTDEKKRFYFYTVETDPKELKATALTRDAINDTLSALPGKALAFLDACHAGAVDGTKTRGDVDMTEIVNDFAGTDSGAVVFASSTGREVSQEHADWGNGAFTEALVEGLSGAADLIEDGSITTSELDAFVVNKVKALTGGVQHPVMIRPATVPDFPIATVRP